jgi:RNA-binding protein Musashi
MPKDYHTGRMQGFGFVTYANDNSITEALEAAPHALDGAELEVKRAQPRECTSLVAGMPGVNLGAPPLPPSPRSSAERLFVGRLPETVTEESLREYFERFGHLTDAYMPKDYHTGRMQGFGFVTYAEPHGVSDALASGPHALDGVELEVKKAQPKERNTRQSRRGSAGMNGGALGSVLPMCGPPPGVIGMGSSMGGPMGPIPIGMPPPDPHMIPHAVMLAGPPPPGYGPPVHVGGPRHGPMLPPGPPGMGPRMVPAYGFAPY